MAPALPCSHNAGVSPFSVASWPVNAQRESGSDRQRWTAQRRTESCGDPIAKSSDRSMDCRGTAPTLGVSSGFSPRLRPSRAVAMATRTVSDASQRRLESLRRQLLDTRAHLREELTFLTSASREWERTARDEPERQESGALSYERDASLALGDQVRRRLADVEVALDRMDTGTFGVCDRCGCPVERNRLEALPETPYCLQCARAMPSVTAVAAKSISVPRRARSDRADRKHTERRRRLPFQGASGLR